MKTIEINVATGLVSEGENNNEDIIIEFPNQNYSELVSMLIAEKYNIQNEIAINRQRETKVDEFNEYFDFCEACKAEAKRLTQIQI